jgi:hypothetical protein
MKQTILCFCFLVSTSATFAATPSRTKNIPDLPPDATSADYQMFQKHISNDPRLVNDDGLDEMVAAGIKNLQWLIKINAGRDEGSRLSFTDANHRIGYPIERPNTYSPSIIVTRYQDFMAKAPQEFRDVVMGAKEVPATLPTSITAEEYLNYGRDLDRIYQISTRWRLMAPYMVELAQRSADDVRGYFFLSVMADHEEKLSHFSTLSDFEKNQFTGWLIQMCRNTNPEATDCDKQLDQSVAAENGSALKFYNSFLAAAKDHYDSYFKIPDGIGRTDMVWAHETPNLTTIPFLDPMDDVFRKFMLNVEDEWHWGDWHLRLNFVQTGDVAHLTFEPGVTPHVNGVGGNTITMDQNTPLSDWEVNWTIRHEFGHVLGFLDCYIEFYDEPNQTMVAYQLDLTNLMCSRKGNLKETHYDELKRVYFK